MKLYLIDGAGSEAFNTGVSCNLTISASSKATPSLSGFPRSREISSTMPKITRAATARAITEKMTASQLIFDGKVVKLYLDTVELPDGNSATREFVKHVGAVCVGPITDAGEVLLERQYRYAVDQILTEIPAGKLDPDQVHQCGHGDQIHIPSEQAGEDVHQPLEDDAAVGKEHAAKDQQLHGAEACENIAQGDLPVNAHHLSGDGGLDLRRSLGRGFGGLRGIFGRGGI